MFGANVNRIVVNQTVLDGPGKIDAPRAVILADVVAHNRPGVPGALFGAVAAFIADQQESAVVVVAIIGGAGNRSGNSLGGLLSS